MDRLQDALERIERKRKRLEVYTDDDELAAELRTQFSTRNVDVVRRQLTGFDQGFAVIRDADEVFRGAIGLNRFDAIRSPEIHPPWSLDATDVDTRDLFDFLENTLFASYDRKRMLAAAREIEERAWRVGEGRLYTGFQREAAFEDQADVYERLGSRGALTVAGFVDDEIASPVENVTVVTPDADEIGTFWFVVFDGGGSDLQTCALLAREKRENTYGGFWTYDPGLVDELLEYLEENYDVSES
nr:DICT sensory domain-containing protein [Natronobacterium texcoconense]